MTTSISAGKYEYSCEVERDLNKILEMLAIICEGNRESTIFAFDLHVDKNEEKMNIWDLSKLSVASIWELIGDENVRIELYEYKSFEEEDYND